MRRYICIGQTIRREIENPYLWRHFYVWKYNDIYGNLIRCDGKAREAVAERCRQELEADRKILEQNGSREHSEAIRKFLDHSWDELRQTVEVEFRKQQEGKKRQAKFFSQIRSQRIVIFGCGQRGRALADLFGFVPQDICCLTDNNTALWHSEIAGHMVLPPEEAKASYSDALFVVANKLHAQEIVEQLRNMGIAKDRICVC